MEALIAVLLIYICIYCGFIIALIIGYNRIQTFAPKIATSETTFSIVIPFRNEQKNLHRLLESLALLDYPRQKFELIFVDDNSDDFSVNVINKWRMANGLIPSTLLENLRLSNSPKKDAITRAMQIVENKWVVTTDADCIVPATWLQTLNSYIATNNVEMIAGSIVYDGKNNFRDHFQRLDVMSLQGATIGGFGLSNAFMCNGANFAYTKNLFLKLGGFTGNADVASGDDVFLLQKAVAQDPEVVHYLKSESAIVRTNPAQTWLELLNQRVRWASKANRYQSTFGSDLAIVVLFANFTIVLATILAAVKFIEWKWVLLIFILKLIPDLILLIQTNKYLRNGKFFFPLFAAIFYPFFCVLIGIFAVVGHYKWKNRSYKT